MTLLLLAGTREAKIIARHLAEAGVDALASYAGATRAPDPLAIQMRVGGFGGEEGFRRFVKDHGITRVLDATHPFADRITQRSARICAEIGVPYAYVLRPPWTAGPEDRWIDIDEEREAALHIHASASVFLATGRQTLEAFANLAPRRVICRQIDPPTGPFPFRGGEFMVGRPPFSVEAETKLFEHLGIDVLVVKNAGGEASRSKLDAARKLGILVLMLRRPAPPDALMFSGVEEAVEWATA